MCFLLGSYYCIFEAITIKNKTEVVYGSLNHIHYIGLIYEQFIRLFLVFDTIDQLTYAIKTNLFMYTII